MAAKNGFLRIDIMPVCNYRILRHHSKSFLTVITFKFHKEIASLISVLIYNVFILEYKIFNYKPVF